MLSPSFPPSFTPTTTFSCKTLSSPSFHVRSRQLLTATQTEHQQRSSYLSTQSMASCMSLYEILEITAAASDQEIKAAYRRLARVFHPDVVEGSSADEFMKIHSAYSTLSNPEKRASYDRSLLRYPEPLTTTASKFSSYTGRNWETDQCWWRVDSFERD